MNTREYEIMYQVEDKHWWYSGIHRLIVSTLARLHRPGTAWRILDAGCGTGAVAAKLRRFGRVTAIDLTGVALALSRRRGLAGSLAQASVTALPLPAATFDLVVSIDVICSVLADNLALAEFARVLQPGGRLLLNLPALAWLRGRHDRAVDILHRYSPGALQAQLAAAGLTVEKMTFANSLLFPVVAPYRLLTNLLPAASGPVPSDVYALPGAVNAILGRIMGLEARLVPYFNLPLGMSLFVLARKDGR